MSSGQFFYDFYQIWNTNYTLHFFLLGCHDNATILAGLCTHSRPSGNIKCYAKLKVFTRSGRAATSEWPRLWSFKIIKWLRATLHCVTDYYTHFLFCCKPGESSNSRPILAILYKLTDFHWNESKEKKIEKKI